MLENTSKLDRRSFLKKVCNLFSFIGLVMTVGLYLLFAFPKQIRKKKDVYVYACDEEELTVQGVRQYYIEYPLHGKAVTKKTFIVNTGKELFALSAVCTHLGCLTNWHRPENRFLCPCHGGQYDTQGNVVTGPPPAPLNRLPLKIEHQKVYIGLRV
jgi:cytochrome b6-f complex iron-sulfur subunit